MRIRPPTPQPDGQPHRPPMPSSPSESTWETSPLASSPQIDVPSQALSELAPPHDIPPPRLVHVRRRIGALATPADSPPDQSIPPGLATYQSPENSQLPNDKPETLPGVPMLRRAVPAEAATEPEETSADASGAAAHDNPQSPAPQEVVPDDMAPLEPGGGGGTRPPTGPPSANISGEPDPEKNRPRNYGSEARILVFAERNPEQRLAMINTLIRDGETHLTPFALGALDELSQVSAHNPEARDAEVQGTAVLAQRLTEVGAFDAAEQVVDRLITLDPRKAMTGVAHLLENGYAGKDDAYLQLDIGSFIANSDKQWFSTDIRKYIEGLAAYGIDVLSPSTQSGRLLKGLIDTVSQSSPYMRDQYYDSITYAFGKGGHFGKAIEAKNRIADPFARSRACMNVIRPEHDPPDELVDQLVAEMRELLPLVQACNGSCDRPHCNPLLDVPELKVNMASVLAHQGDTVGARALVGETTPIFAAAQAKVHAEIYKSTGDMAARTQALEAFTMEQSNIVLEDTFITDIAAADQHWGRVMPSPFVGVENETTPLICWELHSLYDTKTRLERQFETEDISEEHEDLRMMWLGEDRDDYVATRASLITDSRDANLATMVRALLAVNANQSARYLVDKIESPMWRAQALNALGRAFGS